MSTLSYLSTGHLSPTLLVDNGISTLLSFLSSLEATVQPSRDLLDLPLVTLAYTAYRLLFFIAKTWTKSVFLGLKYYYIGTLLWSCVNLFMMVRASVDEVVY